MQSRFDQLCPWFGQPPSSFDVRIMTSTKRTAALSRLSLQRLGRTHSTFVDRQMFRLGLGLDPANRAGSLPIQARPERRRLRRPPPRRAMNVAPVGASQRSQVHSGRARLSIDDQP